MEKILVMVTFVMLSIIVYALNNKPDANQGEREVTGDGEVVIMDKGMLLKDVFGYKKSEEWKYKDDKPTIIDLYADWYDSCRQIASTMEELVKEYVGRVAIYEVSVDKQRKLVALLNATNIPLFVFIPMKEGLQLFRRAVDKATYKRAIDEFLLK